MKFIDEATILAEIDQLVGRWATERNADECFGDYVIRAGIVAEVVISIRDFHD